MPTVYQSSHTGSNIDIAITKTLGCQGLPSVSNSDSGKMLQVVNGLWSAVQPDSNLTMASVLDTVYPVGAIYLSVNSTSPATLFGGTWEQIKGSFLYGCEDSGIVAGDTGGQKSVSYTPEGSNSGGSVSSHTLTTTEIPAHAHGLNNHTHSVGAHAHGLNGHTHNYVKATGTNGNSGNTSSVRIEFSKGSACSFMGSQKYIDVREVNNTFSSTYGGGISSAYGTTSSHPQGLAINGYQDHTHTHNGHTHSVTTSTVASNGPSTTNTANSEAFNTGGNTGNTANAGGGGGHDHGFTNPTFSGTAATIATMPPYLAVYIWKRTA